MAKKVFVVTEESAIVGAHDIEVRVFAELKEAQECFNEKVQLWRDCYQDEWKESESDGYYESWHDGYYDEDHVTICLEEKEVEE